MTKRGGRTQPCDRTQARIRLENAQKSLEVAELAAGEEEIPASGSYTRVNAHELRGAIKRLRWVGLICREANCGTRNDLLYVSVEKETISNTICVYT